MVDIVPRSRRSQMMAGITGKDTKPEMIIRSGLHKMGFRYRVHDKRLPGKPDLVFPKYRAIILVNGCFWHMHECHLFRWPKTRPEFWRHKLQRNKERDTALLKLYAELGWRTMVIWECSLKGPSKRDAEELLSDVAKWLRSDTSGPTDQ